MIEKAYKYREEIAPDLSEEKRVVKNKKSRYNVKVMVTSCSICGKEAEETHHIKEQHKASNGFVEGVRLNHKFNLLPLCKECIQKIREENRRKYLEIEKQKVQNLYKGMKQDQLNTKNGVFKPYGKTERILPTTFSLANTEVKKVCLHSNRGSKSCMWVSYQGDRIIWNIIPEYRRESLGSYSDPYLGKEHYFDKGVTQTYARNWFRGSYTRVHINGKYRTADMDFKAFISYKGAYQPVKINYR